MATHPLFILGVFCVLWGQGLKASVAEHVRARAQGVVDRNAPVGRRSSLVAFFNGFLAESEVISDREREATVLRHLAVRQTQHVQCRAVAAVVANT